MSVICLSDASRTAVAMTQCLATGGVSRPDPWAVGQTRTCLRCGSSLPWAGERTPPGSLLFHLGRSFASAQSLSGTLRLK